MSLLTAAPADNNAPGQQPEAPSTPTAGGGSIVLKNADKSIEYATALPQQVAACIARDRAIEGMLKAADPAWVGMAQAALLAAIDRLGTATVDDVRDAIPPPLVPCWWCCVPRTLAAQGTIHRVGTRIGQSPITHGGDLRLWARKGTP